MCERPSIGWNRDRWKWSGTGAGLASMVGEVTRKTYLFISLICVWGVWQAWGSAWGMFLVFGDVFYGIMLAWIWEVKTEENQREKRIDKINICLIC